MARAAYFDWNPDRYISKQESQARERLCELANLTGIKVHSTEMVCDGWGDGMQVVQAVVETRSGDLLKLKWMDSSVGRGEFGIKRHGTSRLSDDLNELR